MAELMALERDSDAGDRARAESDRQAGQLQQLEAELAATTQRQASVCHPLCSSFASRPAARPLHRIFCRCSQHYCCNSKVQRAQEASIAREQEEQERAAMARFAELEAALAEAEAQLTDRADEEQIAALEAQLAALQEQVIL